MSARCLTCHELQESVITCSRARNLHPPKPDRNTKGPTCNLFASGKYPTRVPQIPPGGFPDTPMGFKDPFPEGRDIRISVLCGRPAANYHRAIMRQQEPPAQGSGFSGSFPEAASAACAAPAGGC